MKNKWNYHDREAITNKVLALPAQPTAAMPGSRAKLLVMIARVARGESPMHPEDASDGELPALQSLRFDEFGNPVTQNNRGRPCSKAHLRRRAKNSSPISK